MNALKSILVQMDNSQRSLVRLQVANELATAHAATVRALYPQGPVYVPTTRRPLYEGQSMLPVVADPAVRVSAVRALFDQAGAGSASFASVTGDPVRAFARQALCADLLVLGQQQPDDDQDSDLPPDFAESVLMASRKPGIVVPHIGLLSPVGGVVLVAWKASPESARALAAALPLLQRADQVLLATWDDPNPPAQPEAEVDVVGWLALHGVKATLTSHGAATRELGEQLLSMVVDVGAGLLVMGCYGQSRAREWVLGGATRSILNSMTVPVLMSH